MTETELPRNNYPLQHFCYAAFLKCDQLHGVVRSCGFLQIKVGPLGGATVDFYTADLYLILLIVMTILANITKRLLQAAAFTLLLQTWMLFFFQIEAINSLRISSYQHQKPNAPHHQW